MLKRQIGKKFLIPGKLSNIDRYSNLFREFTLIIRKKRVGSVDSFSTSENRTVIESRRHPFGARFFIKKYVLK